MLAQAPSIAPFRNEPIRTFREPAERESLAAAIAQEQALFGTWYPLVIGEARITTRAVIESRNPARPDQVVGRVSSARAEDAREAIDVAARTFETWGHVPAMRRATVLFRAAELVRARRDTFNALLMLEVGKTRIEADGDTAEAIDFLEFYGREALRYDAPPPLIPVSGERNVLRYLPLGVGIVIPPWNFAFAIMAGMTAAALVTGNTVVLKPSSDSPVIAARFVDLLLESGLPPGVVNFVPGSGREVGDLLVADPRTRFIAFTGSKDVGLHINELAAKTQPGQRWIKRVIAEMGGKDAIVIAADADVNAAADAVAASAFGFSGQKCSACSRAIVEDAVHDRFVDALLARVATFRVGDPLEADTMVGPVINEAARRTIEQYIEIGRSEGRLIAGGERVTGDGYLVAPAILDDVDSQARIAQEEIFGPVLAIVRARDFDHAIEIANDTEFGLTGAVFSSDPRKLAQAADSFFVGNLYFNRKCTGALVGAHPFGGFNMSGTDSKAGGSDYLLLFLQAKAIAAKVSDADRADGEAF